MFMLPSFAASLRLLRRTIGLKDEFYNRHIIKFDLMKIVVDAFVANGQKYNLFNSAVLELFEFVKSVSISFHLESFSTLISGISCIILLYIDNFVLLHLFYYLY